MAERETHKHEQAKIRLPADSLISLQLSIVSYVPHATDEDGVTIAVLVSGAGSAEVRFITDWRTVLERDPEADVELLTALADEIRGKLQTPGECEDLLSRMQASWSNTIRVSPWKACFVADPKTEMETLVALYLR